jgi:hypothetical protein
MTPMTITCWKLASAAFFSNRAGGIYIEDTDDMDTPKGKIIASCGHQLAGTDEGEMVMLKADLCDTEGYHRAVQHSFYCPACAAEAKEWPEYMPNVEAADAWLKSGREPRDRQRQREGT